MARRNDRLVSIDIVDGNHGNDFKQLAISVYMSSWEEPVILNDFNQTWISSTDFW